MTATVAETGVPLGPGTLKFGATGTEIDVSCNVNNAVISAEKDEGDSVTKLCGTTVPGAISFTYTLSGNLDTDIGSDTGFFAMTQNQAGEQVEFSYVPNTEAGTEAAGTCVLVPLDFGGDETTQTMTSDFEFTVVGAPVYTYSGVAGTQEAETDDQREAVPA